jgi:hypothetical protein
MILILYPYTAVTIKIIDVDIKAVRIEPGVYFIRISVKLVPESMAYKTKNIFNMNAGNAYIKILFETRLQKFSTHNNLCVIIFL